MGKRKDCGFEFVFNDDVRKWYEKEVFVRIAGKK